MAVRVVAGQVVVIAGGGLGVGALAARTVAQVGGEALVAQRGVPESLTPAPEGRGRITALEAEGGTPESLCEAAVASARRLDALIYVAAPALVSPYWQLDDAAWARGVTEPLLDAHRWARAAMLVMRAQRFGRIIAIGPAAGLEPNDDRVAPSTLGGALCGLVSSLAYAGLRFNVQCHALRLGVRTVELGDAPESLWPELGPRLVELLGGRLDGEAGQIIDIGAPVASARGGESP